MSVILNDPCDNFTFAPWTVVGTPSISASGLHGNAFSIPAGGGNTCSYNPVAGNQTDTMTIGLNVKFSVLNATAQAFLVWRSDSGTVSHGILRVNSAGTLEYVRSASVLASSPSGTIAINTWYLLEAAVKLSDTVGAVTVKVNGTQVLAASNVDTNNGGTKTVFDRAQLVGMNSTGAWLADDVYIRNDFNFGLGVTVKTWNGSAFVDSTLRTYNGSAFVDAVALKTWNGSAFV